MSAVRHRMGAGRGALALATVTAATIALVVAYLALGGGSYKPLKVADPCKPRALAPGKGFGEISQQILLSGLDGAACRLRVTREELALALTSESSRQRFAREHSIGDTVLQDAIRQGLQRAVLDAERADRLSEAQASVLRAVVATLPMATLIEAARSGKGLAEVIGGFLQS